MRTPRCAPSRLVAFLAAGVWLLLATAPALAQEAPPGDPPASPGPTPSFPGAVATVLWVVGALLAARPFPRAANHVPNFVLAVGRIVAAPALMRGWIDLVNAGSGALLDPMTGLPGLSQVEGFDRLSVLGVIGPVYLLFALLLAFQRAKLLLYVVLLLVAAPVALAAWAIPAGYAQRFVRWWGATFLAVTLVRVLQAAVLAHLRALERAGPLTQRFQLLFALGAKPRVARA